MDSRYSHSTGVCIDILLSGISTVCMVSGCREIATDVWCGLSLTG